MRRVLNSAMQCTNHDVTNQHIKNEAEYRQKRII